MRLGFEVLDDGSGPEQPFVELIDTFAILAATSDDLWHAGASV